MAYDSDPKVNAHSKMYKNISYKKVLSDNKVMDLLPFQWQEIFIPMVVFSILKNNSFLNATLGRFFYYNFGKIHLIIL